MEVWVRDNCICYSPHLGENKGIFNFNIKNDREGEAVHSGVLSKSTGVGEKELSPSLLVRVTGEGRAPSTVPLGEGKVLSICVCTRVVWELYGLCPVPPLAPQVCWLLLSPHPGLSVSDGGLCSWICPWFVLCCSLQVLLSASSSSSM